MEKDGEEVQKKINYLIEYHTKDLERMKENLKNFGLKKIAKQLLEEAIRDKEELLKNLQK